jgi:hypothetical protein
MSEKPISPLRQRMLQDEPRKLPRVLSPEEVLACWRPRPGPSIRRA